MRVVIAGVVLFVLGGSWWRSTSAGQVRLRLVDDRGRAIISRVEICFQFERDRPCQQLDGGEMALPASVSTVYVEGEDHGPVTERRIDLKVGPDGTARIEVPRKALLRVDGPARREPLSISLYPPSDGTFREPFFRVRLAAAESQVKIPAGAFIASLVMARRAPDLHRLVAAPDGRARVVFTARDGWSLVARFRAREGEAPLAGASMRVVDAPGYGVAERRLGEAMAGPEGIALFSGIRVATVGLSAWHEGFLPARVQGVVASPGTFALRDVALAVGGRLRAEILLRDHAAAGAVCRLSTLDAANHAAPYRRVWEGQSNAAGACLSPILESGDYRLDVEPSGSAAAEVRWISISEGQETVEKVALYPTRVTGKVRRHDTGVAGYSVQATHIVLDWPLDAPAERAAKAVTDGDGAYDLTLLTPGRYALQLRSTSGGWLGGHKELRTVGGEDKTVDFDLAAAPLHGTVLDDAHAPVAGAHVVVSSRSGAFIVTTDDAGSFEFEVQDDNLVRVSAGKQGYRGSGSVEVQVGQDAPPAPPIDLTIHRADTLEGTVVSASGIPVAGAAIASVALGSDGPELFDLTRSDAVGGFEVPVPAGAPLLFVSGPGCPLFAFAASAANASGAGDDADDGLVIQCPAGAGALDVSLAEASGKPISSAGLILRTGGVVVPREVLENHLMMMGVPAATDGSGHLVVPELAAGSYDLFLATQSSVATIAAGRQDGFLTSVELAPQETLEIQALPAGSP